MDFLTLDLDVWVWECLNSWLSIAVVFSDVMLGSKIYALVCDISYLRSALVASYLRFLNKLTEHIYRGR